MNPIVAGPHVTPVAYGLVRGTGRTPDGGHYAVSWWHATPVPIAARHIRVIARGMDRPCPVPYDDRGPMARTHILFASFTRYKQRPWLVTRAWPPDWLVVEMVDSQLVNAPARWLTLSLGERDNWRKFLFAYCGLETLANKFIAASRPALIDTLRGQLPGAPVEELLWPETRQSLVFAFAAMSTVVNPEMAESDMVLFRAISKARNALAHGATEDLTDLPAADAVTLLRRYLVAVVENVESRTGS